MPPACPFMQIFASNLQFRVKIPSGCSEIGKQPQGGYFFATPCIYSAIRVLSRNIVIAYYCLFKIIGAFYHRQAREMF